MSLVQLITTLGSKEEALDLARAAVGARLAACVWTSQDERLWDGQVRAMEKAGVDLLVIGRRYDDRQMSEIERFASEFL